MLRGCQAGQRRHRGLGEPPLRGLFAAGKNAETDFHRCGASQERPRQGVARPPAGGLDCAHEGVGMSVHASTLRGLLAARKLSCAAKAPLKKPQPPPEERALTRASRRMAASQCRASILRDADLRSAPQDEVVNLFKRPWSLTSSISGLFTAIAFAFVSATSLHAEDLWRHGTLVPKGDAGFIYMAAEGGFAKAEGLDLKMQAFQNDTLMMKAVIAGELDSYEGSPISPLIAGSKGADVKILGCTWPKLTYSLFSHDGI